MVYLDAIRADGPRLFTGSPPARLTSRSGRGMDGCQARGLSIWARGGSLPQGRLVCAELANRGVKDVLIVEGAPPARERSARGNVTGSPAFPRRTQAVLAPGHGPHLRGYHPVPCPWMRFVSYGDRRKVAAALKAVYTAPNQEAAWQALTDFSESDMGVKYPQTVTTWERAWERFTPLPGLTGRCSGVSSLPHFVGGTPSTNSIETASYQLRKDHR